MTHCLTEFPFFLKYLTNAEYMMSVERLHQNRVSLDRSMYHRYSQSQKPLSLVQNMVCL